MQYDLSRFIKAQESEYWGYSIALREIKNGRKDSHWIKKNRPCMTFLFTYPDTLLGHYPLLKK